MDRALKLGLNVYVHGPPGIGRTSFLRQIQRERPEARYARLHGFGTLIERLEEVELRLTRRRILTRKTTMAQMLGRTTDRSVEDPL